MFPFRVVNQPWNIPRDKNPAIIANPKPTQYPQICSNTLTYNFFFLTDEDAERHSVEQL